ncbi:Flp pilus assembly protein CpaB [Actinoplanes sp. NPDC049265]|uniref:Flp pilus assembly protein CpaB n=1 Tax=Actinoplanes sp. NPDC049265 TaxID=3363902 RepID=UPI003712F158
MRRRVLIVLAALVLGGLSAMAVLVYARGADRRAVAGREGVWVLLAQDKIPRGTTGEQIRSGRLAGRVLMPAATVPEGALTDIDGKLDSKRLATDLMPDQMLMRGLFTDAGDMDRAGVPDGKLAVSVAVAMAPGVAEKVTSGDKVTVFVTYAKDDPPSRQRTRVLLPEATVISIDSGPPSDVTPSPATSSRLSVSTRSSSRQADSYPATLAVDQGQATRLVHAAQTGLIYLGLVGADASVGPSAAVNYDNIWPKG